MIVTCEQWERYIEKYGNLMWTISHRISGDPAIASLEDNYADLCLAGINSIKGFNRKTGEDFDQMMGNKLFDQYTKTVLWNFKNKKGKRITQKKPMLSKTTSIDAMFNNAKHDDLKDNTFDIEDTKQLSSLDSPSFITENMDVDSQKIVDTIIKDPSVLDANGKLKMYSLIKPTGLTIHAIRKAVEKLEHIFGDNYV